MSRTRGFLKVMSEQEQDDAVLMALIDSARAGRRFALSMENFPNLLRLAFRGLVSISADVTAAGQQRGGEIT